MGRELLSTREVPAPPKEGNERRTLLIIKIEQYDSVTVLLS